MTIQASVYMTCVEVFTSTLETRRHISHRCRFIHVAKAISDKYRRCSGTVHSVTTLSYLSFTLKCTEELGSLTVHPLLRTVTPCTRYRSLPRRMGPRDILRTRFTRRSRTTVDCHVRKSMLDRRAQDNDGG